jgi:hypothetical protein
MSMQRRKKFGVDLATTCGVIIAIFMAQIPSANEVVTGNEKASLSLDQPKPHSPDADAGLSPTPTKDYSAVEQFAGLSSLQKNTFLRYEFVKDCANFSRFEAVYREKASDPNWPLNNPSALKAADPKRRANLIETSRFIDEHREACKPWIDGSPRDLVNVQIYEASLQAALEGDDNAAACFVFAAWQAPDRLSPYYEKLRNNYSEYAPRLIERGLKTGNWPIAVAAYQASQEEHGIETSAGFSAQTSYMLARLVQQGSPDALSESQHGYRAENIARTLTAAELVDLDRQASELFNGVFNKKKVDAQSVVDMCVN